MDVRLATSSDAEGIARAQERAWQTAYRHVFPAAELERGGFIRPERWRERLAVPPPGWTTFVAVEADASGAGGVQGFVSVGPSRDERGIGELYAIYVHPDAWATGVGRALIERGELELRAHYEEATLWVLEDNPRARSFYEAAGWWPDGATKADERWGVRAPEVRYRKELAGGGV
jgi:ribosomal protein S18 acetylase RimI-like enzyme